jgi:RNA polymerase sigma-70 factor (ECF subfamily)
MSPPAPDGSHPTGDIAEDLFRRESGRLVAILTGQLGVHRLQLAEDVVQEALVRALQTWPYRGVPDNPAAWLTQTAKNLALDHLRREQRWQDKEPGIANEHARWLATPTAGSEEAETGGLGDETLRMLFICFHPQLSVEAQTALALRTLCGLSPAEIAAAFLSTEAAISKRLVRARQRIRELELPFSVPGPEELPTRLDGVLGTLYLLFSEGHKASGGDRLVREDLCHEAIRLALQLTTHPATRQPKTHALLALMLLNAARLPGRTDDSGQLLRLQEQDRRLWIQPMIQQGIQHLALSAAGNEITEYHLEAGIAACHSTASDDATTDWNRILGLYDQLARLSPSPIIALNRSVAVARVHGPAAGLEAMDRIARAHRLENYHLFHAVRGSFELELGRFDEALASFRKAQELAVLPSERAFLARRIQECEAKLV